MGERIAICAPNVLEWVVLYLSAALAGNQVVPLNPSLREHEMKRIVVDANCSAMFVVAEHRGNDIAQIADRLKRDVYSLRQIVDLQDWDSFTSGSPQRDLPVLKPSDIALVQYTSGTTGPAKGVLLTHHALTDASIRSGRALGIHADDVYANPFPLFHVGGTVGAIGVCLAAGATLALLPAYSADDMIDLIANSEATIAAGVPTVLRGLLSRLHEQPELSSRLRVINTGATTVPAHLIEEYEALGIRISVSYGQSECPTITRTRVSDDPLTRARTVGQPVDGLEVKVVDIESRKTTAIGAVGELCVRGTNVMSGYLGHPVATRAVLDADGWLCTGDLATMTAGGHCSIVGRLKDLIIRGGENVHPREVEEVLTSHPDVDDAAVIGSPDDEFGEQVLGVIVPAPGRSIDWSQLTEFARTELASFKVPRRWKLASELPRNAAGKVEKHRLDNADYEIVEDSHAKSR